MTEHAAQLVAKIEGALTTDDGRHMLLKLVMADGAKTVLAIPREQIGAMVDHAALGMAQSDEAIKTDPAPRAAFSTSWWELSVDAKTQQILLSLTFGTGGRLHFVLPSPMPQHMYETLEVMLGKSTLEKPRTPVN